MYESTGSVCVGQAARCNAVTRNDERRSVQAHDSGLGLDPTSSTFLEVCGPDTFL